MTQSYRKTLTHAARYVRVFYDVHLWWRGMKLTIVLYHTICEGKQGLIIVEMLLILTYYLLFTAKRLKYDVNSLVLWDAGYEYDRLFPEPICMNKRLSSTTTLRNKYVRKGQQTRS